MLLHRLKLKLWLPSVFILTLGLGLTILAVKSAPDVDFLEKRIFPSLIPLAVYLLCLGWQSRRRGSLPVSGVEPGQPRRWTLACLLLVFSFWFTSTGLDEVNSWTQSQRFRAGMWDIRFRWAVVAAVVLGLGLQLERVRRFLPWFSLCMALAGLLWCAQVMWQITGGEPLYRDDHPSFMHRLTLFADTFPRVLVYEPMWNGGKIQSYLASTGTTAPGVLAWPLWRFFPVHEVYTPALMWLYFGVTPVVVALAAWVGRAGGLLAVSLAALLSVACTGLLHTHQLHYGTIGFVTAMPFLVLALSCLFRIGVEHDFRARILLGLLVSGFFFLCWPAGLLVAVLPVSLAMLTCLPGMRLRHIGVLLLVAAGITFLLLPNIIAVLLHSKAGGLDEIVKETAGPLGILAAQAIRIHPWVLFAGGLGIVLHPPGPFRRFYGAALLGLAVTFVFGGAWLPAFELERAAVPFSLVAILPSVRLIEQWLRSGPAPRFAAAFGLALIAAGTLVAVDVYGNRSIAPYRDFEIRVEEGPINGTRFAYVDEFVDWAREAPRDGRIAFLGRIKSRISRAHAGYLPHWAGRPMLACDYHEFPPELYDLRQPPGPWHDQGYAGWVAWLDRMNVDYVVVYQDDANPIPPMPVVTSHPEDFSKVFEFGLSRRFYVYEVLRPGGWFVGEPDRQGTVTCKPNAIDVELADPQSPVTLCLNWEDGLELAGGPGQIEPVEVVDRFADGSEARLRFIRLDPQGAKSHKIIYRRWR